MTLEKVTNVETNKIELEISVNAEDFEVACQKSYRKNVGKMNVPGFRRGKAPRKMLEQMYGASVFYDDAVQELYPDALDAAIKEANLIVVSRPDVEMISVDSENGFKFKAVVFVKPEVTVKEYKNLSVEKISNVISEEDVTAELKRVQERQARLVDLDDGETILTDTVVFDFDGYVDDVAFDGGKAEGYSLKLGSGQFIPGFEDQMVGKKIGDEFDVNVDFPEEYHAEELKGKPAVFKVKIHEIKRQELPEINDEFAKDVSDFETLEEYKKDLTEKLQTAKDKEVEQDIENKISVAISELIEAEIPECMFDNEIEQSIQNFERRMSGQGLNLQQYLEYTGQEFGAFREMFRENAERDVKIRLVLEKIAEIEQVVISEEDIAAEYAKFETEMKIEIDKIKSPYMDENISKDLTLQKAYQLVKNNANIIQAVE